VDSQLTPGLPARPQRSDVTDGYDRGAATYEELWSPVVLPPLAARR
jgi:hypothetical protein